jgi:PTH1 family peptidyl-tRNA hydrolase
MTTPRRLVFIASIGNQKPYRSTRHSAGHILLDALLPHLRTRFASVDNYYTTYHSPSFMNDSGPKLVRNLNQWLTQADKVVGPPRTGFEVPTPVGVPATLVILHDELEAPLGKVRVKRGGPEAASLRGHRGLISSFESLRGKGMYPVKGKGRDLSVLRVGVGIGRPESREKNAVADYVLQEMGKGELDAVRRAAEPVLSVLEEEFFWEGGSKS